MNIVEWLFAFAASVYFHFFGTTTRYTDNNASYTLDLHAAMPYWNMTDDQRQELWSDGLHFTAEGYELMGSIISDRLFEIISEQPSFSVETPVDGSQKLLDSSIIRPSADGYGVLVTDVDTSDG